MKLSPNGEVLLFELIGRHEKEVRGFLEQQGMTMRVVKRDGKGLVFTMECRPNRVNVRIENEVVVGVDGVG